MENIVSPSLLSCDFLNIEKELTYFSNEKDLWFHLDIMDGHFVPNLTFGHEIVKRISKKTSIPLDAHLMVSNPEFYAETFKDYNLHNFTFHIEASEDPLKVIELAHKYYPNVGISIKPNTEVSALSEKVLESVELILVMSVEPGFGGQKFMENSLDKVEQLSNLRSKNNYKYTIQVDGGINGDNASKLRQRGADNLVAGSYIFKAGPNGYSEKISTLR